MEGEGNGRSDRVRVRQGRAGQGSIVLENGYDGMARLQIHNETCHVEVGVDIRN